ncbi:transcriptional regulator [Opitutaceae bacterium TAV4]|nr:transcriptional regulator [Opitutaceae bacterium TAV4]RRK00680.1 transcriptional regulator [Opitutaceae bacterium TAV3]
MITAPTEPRKWRIANQLREARTNQGLSQGQLANIIYEAGLTYFKLSHLSRLECGYLDATLTEVRIIATILDVLPDWLIGRAKPAPPPTGALASTSTPPIPPSGAPASQPAGLAAAVNGSNGASSNGGGTTNPDDWPDMALLDRGEQDTDVFKQKLNDGLVRAQTMLHRSGLPAAPWRAWRDFDRQARELLRQLG